jgi:hypothetical protein
MTDRELLELAAKAAGYALCEWPDETGKLRAEIEPNWRPVWNPLTSDGDALRLAVKLRLPLRDGLNGTVETGNERSGRPIWEFWGTDPYAATRRAIVRAAAEIGRAMK